MFDSNYLDILQKICMTIFKDVSQEFFGNFGVFLYIYILKMMVKFGEYISKHLSIIIFKFKITCFKV